MITSAQKLPAPGLDTLASPESHTPVQRVTLSNGSIAAAVLTRGAILQDLRLAGLDHGLTVGSPDVKAYSGPLCYFGAVVGPVANRIAQGRARLGADTYIFDRNEHDTHTLHGGATGTHGGTWDIDIVQPDRVCLTLALPDGTGGFPGNRTLAADYALIGTDTLELTLTAATDADTWLNLAHHGFWNLDGGPDLTGHRLWIAADSYLPTDARAMVTGEVAPVAGSPFDFRSPRAIGPGTEPRLDHNFCLASARRAPEHVLTLTGASGIAMEVSTSETGVQIYDAGGFDGGGARDHAGHPIGPFCGLAIEPQGWPDAPNQPAFPSVRVAGGMAIRQITRWRFRRPA
jgi:aldose 1-epimerase